MQLSTSPEDFDVPEPQPFAGEQPVVFDLAEWLAAHPTLPLTGPIGFDPFALAFSYDSTHPGAPIPVLPVTSAVDPFAWFLAHPASGPGIDPFALAHQYDSTHPAQPVPDLPPEQQIDPFAQWWADHHPASLIGQ